MANALPAHLASFDHDDRRHAAALLVLALGFGVTTQALFWRTGIGLNFLLWNATVIGANVLAFRRDRLRPTAWGAMAASLLLAASIVRFESTWALAIALPADLAILALLPILVRDGLDLTGLTNLPLQAFASLGRTPRAVRDACGLPSKAVGGRAGAVAGRIGLGLLIGAPTAGFFTLLLASDRDFAHMLARAADKVGEGMLFVVWSVLTSGGYLVTHALHAGEARAHDAAAPAAGPYRSTEDAAWVAAPPAGRVSPLTWAMVVGQVALVFALFVAANIRHLFGGHAVVHASDGVTYSSYLHAGFAQLLFATILSVCLVLGGHALLLPRGVARLGPVPGGKVLKALESALLVVTAITLASCWQRLAIYEDAYGASHLRLGVGVVMIAVLGVLALTLGKALFRGWAGYGGAVLAYAAGVAVFASAINTDAYIAATNLDRAGRGHVLDGDYLGRLSADARGVVASHPALDTDGALRERLVTQYCEGRAQGWRAFRGIGNCTGFR